MSVDAEVTNWLKIGGQSHFSHSLQDRGSNFQDCWRVNPLGRLYDDDGAPTLMTSGGDSQWWNPLQYLEPDAVVNPLKINRFLGSYYGEIKLPLDGLKYRANIGIDFHSRQDYSFYLQMQDKAILIRQRMLLNKPMLIHLKICYSMISNLENTLSGLLCCNLFSAIELKV